MRVTVKKPVTRLEEVELEIPELPVGVEEFLRGGYGDYFRSLREATGMSPDEFARVIGTTRPTILVLEGTPNPSTTYKVPTLTSMMKVLNWISGGA